MAEYTQFLITSNQAASVALSGTYTFSNATMVVPSGATLPVATVDGQVFWVPPSGALCIASGVAGTWVKFLLS
jgi:hypothetical protein